MTAASGELMSPAGLLLEHLDQEEARIEERRRELLQMRENLRHLTATLSPEPSTPLAADSISDDMAPAVVQRLIQEASGLLRNLVMVVDSGPGLDEGTLRDNQRWIAEGNEQRAIYPATSLDTPQGLQWLRSWAGVGEQQRLLPEVGTEYAVFGDVGAVALARWGDLSSGYVLIRAPLAIATLAAYFDLAWEHAHAVPVAGRIPGDGRLIELLGMGLKDEAIARFLGVSLRTARRRIAALMSIHGVDTRFQLGAALAAARTGAPTVGGRHTR